MLIRIGTLVGLRDGNGALGLWRVRGMRTVRGHGPIADLDAAGEDEDRPLGQPPAQEMRLGDLVAFAIEPKEDAG